MAEALAAGPQRESARALADHLATMLVRLDHLLEREQPSDSDLDEIVTILNNVSFVLVHLEAIAEYVNLGRIVPFKKEFFSDDRSSRARLLLEAALRRAGLAPASLDARLAQLGDALGPATVAALPDVDDLLERASLALEDVWAAQNGLLDRLGLGGSHRNPAAVFYGVLAADADAERRDKLSRAWRQLAVRTGSALIEQVDAIVDRRRRHASALGLESVLARATRNSCLDAEQVEAFLDSYLDHAVRSHEALAADVGAAFGVRGDLVAHFPRYMRELAGTESLPTFPARECMQLVLDVATSMYGLEWSLHETDRRTVVAEPRRGGAAVGTITFDLWATPPEDASVSTEPALDVLAARDRRQGPTANVSCRFRTDEDGSRAMTFQDVQSMYHEFGHALNHLLLARRVPSKSGLDHVPVERLEHVSMWFEKWVYHPDFVSAMSATVAPERVRRCQHMKALEHRRAHLERGITAALDFDLHRRHAGTISDAFEALDRRHGIGRFVCLEEFPPYFTRPSFLANPGADFASLAGSAFSCATFLPVLDERFDVVRESTTARLAGAFDPDLPSELPDPVATFDFYERLRATEPPETASSVR